MKKLYGNMTQKHHLLLFGLGQSGKLFISVLKFACLMAKERMDVYGSGSLNIWKSTISAERRAQVSEQHPGETLHFSASQCPTETFAASNKNFYEHNSKMLKN